MCGVVWCYTGPEEDAEQVFKPIREFGPPAFDGTGPAPFPALQGAFDALYPPGQQWYWKGDYFNVLTDEVIDIHLKFAKKIPTPQSTMHLYPIDGAVQRVASDATAWCNRSTRWSMVIAGVDSDPVKFSEISKWAKDYWQELHPHSTGSSYVNFLMNDDGKDRVEATYGENHSKLVSIKRKYDPGNVFRVNHNIHPGT